MDTMTFSEEVKPRPTGGRSSSGFTQAQKPRDVGTDPIKRVVDIVGAVGALVLFAPLMIVVYLIVRSDGGPAFFGHTRIGRDGQAFKCWKFRSMCVNADEALAKLLETDPAAREQWEKDFKLFDDPRVTWLGNFLRKTSLDELPQILNVLRGEMSLVGPRPIVAAEVPRYRHRIAAYHRCRPGITGLWQVSGRNDVDYDQRVALDATYARNWSVGMDAVILLKTVGVMVNRRGAY